MCFNLEDRHDLILLENFPLRREISVPAESSDRSAILYLSKHYVKVDYYLTAFQNPEKLARAKTRILHIPWLLSLSTLNYFIFLNFS